MNEPLPPFTNVTLQTFASEGDLAGKSEMGKTRPKVRKTIREQGALIV